MLSDPTGAVENLPELEDLVINSSQPGKSGYRYAEPPRLDGQVAERIARAEALFAEAEAGAPPAQYQVARLLVSCNELLDESFPYRLKFLEQEGKPSWYLDKLNSDASACEDMSLYNLGSQEPAYWLNLAKNAGDPAAMAEYLALIANVKDLSGADTLAAKILLAKNGDAYYKLLPYLAHRDRQVGVYDEAFDAARNGAILQLACHFGYSECEPGSRTVYEYCVNAVPMCVPDIGLLDYMKRFEWTAEQAQLYEVLFQQYLQGIERGDVSMIFADN